MAMPSAYLVFFVMACSFHLACPICKVNIPREHVGCKWDFQNLIKSLISFLQYLKNKREAPECYRAYDYEAERVHGQRVRLPSSRSTYVLYITPP
jgi:hypothetical protein